MADAVSNKAISDSLIGKIKQTKEPYWVEVLGEKYRVLPNVYSPKYFEDTQIFAANLPEVADKAVMEVGSGTGVIAITAAKKGAKSVLAVDINPDAVRNTQVNADLHKLGRKIEVRESDVFNSVAPNEKFDLIIWNTPFTWVNEGEISDIEKSVYDPGYKSTERFLREAQCHLLPHGVIYICFSSSIGRVDLLRQLVENSGMNFSVECQIDSESTIGLKYEIFKISPRE
jgi:release factor glutamine methyltransferase